MSRIALMGLAILLSPVAASAATCPQMVAGLQSYLAQHPAQAGTRPQTHAAQLNHQPTRASLAKAKAESHDNLVALLAKAQAEQAAGDAQACRKTLGYVEWMLKL
jgi:hypothetical protein